MNSAASSRLRSWVTPISGLVTTRSLKSSLANVPTSTLPDLKFQLFRAGRCVVDTGMHHLGWSREKAIDYLVALDGDARGFATREIERYCATPGQACSYMVGKLTWLRLRERAKASLGPKFDIREFHDAGLLPGATPLAVLDGIIAGYEKGKMV